MGNLNEKLKKKTDQALDTLSRSNLQAKGVKKKQVLLLLKGDETEEKTILSFLKYLRTESSRECKVFLALPELKKERMKALLKKNGYTGISLLSMEKRSCKELMSSSEYLIASLLPDDFIKKEEQVYLCVQSKVSLESVDRCERKNIFGEAGSRIHNMLICDSLFLAGCAEQDFDENMDLFHVISGKIYCGTEGADSPQNKEVIKDFLFHEGNPRRFVPEEDGRRNILMFCGGLQANGITTALCSRLASLDLKKDRYIMAVRRTFFEGQEELLEILPKETVLLPLMEDMHPDLETGLALFQYYKKGKAIFHGNEKIREAFRREWHKHFGFSRFAHAIQFSGYGRYAISLFGAAPCSSTIWVHNDMQAEVRLRGNANPWLLSDAYKSYTNVAIVSEDLRRCVEELGQGQAHICLVENVHDPAAVVEKSKGDILFDKDTLSTIAIEELKEVLQGPKTKFINIGRFSYEKGHDRLIRAFARYHKENPESLLIIIGGLGEDYEKTLKLARSTSAAGDIILIRHMKNPMPVLKACDCFILSSYYEGLGLVLLEADSLGLPTAACDVTGPAGFMRRYGGKLLEDSEEGIYQGFHSYDKGEIPIMHVDYEAMNRKSREAFYQLFES